MNKSLARFALPVLLFAVTGATQAAQRDISFNPGANDFFEFTGSYVYYVDSNVSPFDTGGYKSVADSTSNQWVLTNSYESSPTIFTSVGGMFDLDALWLAGAWGSQTLTITGYVNGVELYTTTVDVTTTAEQYTFTNFQGIDKFSISTGSNYVKDPLLSNSGKQWALGNVTITAVPEPEAYAMLLAGLAFVGAVARRRRGV